jgi:uncharacterized membrane protein (DUF4010 family)
MNLAAELLPLGTALAAGMLIGIERGWTQRGQRAGSRVAGIRTFAMLGLLGGLAGLLGAKGYALAGGALGFGAAAVLVAAWLPKLRERGDATSAVAALLTLGIGILAGTGAAGAAIAVAAVTVLILAMRDELHGFVRGIDEQDLKALARFAVIALAVLPFLPDEPMGPYGAWNPSKLWWVVVLVTGFSFLGYIANRLFGARNGTIATALIGGAYSSTAVTQSLSQRLGSKEAAGAEAAGIALASAVMYLRVVILVAALAMRILGPFVIVVAPAVIVAWGAGWWLYRKAPRCEGPSPPGNPIALLPALGFLLFVALAAVAARWAEGRFGEEGFAILLFIMGSLDVDAAIVTAGGLPPSAISAELAALAIGGTILANMAVKLGITLAYARSKGIGAALALGASMAALLASLIFWWINW